MVMETSKEESGVVKILLENERVKIYEMHLRPWQKMEMHSHPEYTSYLLTDAKLRIHFPNGITEDRGYKKGEAGYRQAQQHSLENRSDEDIRIVITELKKR